MTDVTSYLKDELDKAKRSYRNTMIAMGVVVVVVFGYFQWLKSELQTVLDPPVLAEFIINEARSNMPGASAALQANLRASAPDIVRFVMKGVVDNVLPMLAEEFQRNLKDYSREVTTIGAAGVMSAFEEVVRTHKDDLLRGGEADPDMIAAELSAHMKAELTKELVDGDGEGGESLQDKLDASVVALQRLNGELKTLSKSRKLSREEEMGKRLITTWWTFLDRNAQDLPGANVIKEQVAEIEPDAKGKKK